MKAIGIAADSTCDLSKELIDKYGFSILPLCVSMGDREYQDGVDITLDELFAWSDQNNKTPKTSSTSPGLVGEFLKARMDEYEHLFFFTIGGKLSSTLSVLQVVAEELELEERVHIIDSNNLSTGIGQMMIEAAEMAERGESVEAITREMDRIRPMVRASFVVDTLTYLHRGGRCSGMTALVGGTLKIHPCIEVEDGVLHVAKKYRGKMEKVIGNYVEDHLEAMMRANKHRIFITHGNCDEAVIQSVVDRIAALAHFDEILITRVGSVIGSHCGPGTLGILYVEEW